MVAKWLTQEVAGLNLSWVFLFVELHVLVHVWVFSNGRPTIECKSA